MTQVSRGSTFVGILATPRTGGVARAWHRLRIGGCDVAEDPRLDARLAQPLWLRSSEELLHVRAVPARGVASKSFDLWRIPGRKRLEFDGEDLTLTAEQHAARMRLSLASSVADGQVYVSTMPLTPGLRGQVERFSAQAKALAGQALPTAHARAVARSTLLHLRAIQALDAVQAGASHRAIAQALFGSEAVAIRWREDGELRAQVRYLVRRAQAFMNGGYRALASVLPFASKHPGDESMR